MQRSLFPLMFLALTSSSFLVAACSYDGSGATGDEGEAAARPDASSKDLDSSRGEASANNHSSEDAASTSDASEDAATANDASKDAGIDAAPLACSPTQLPTTACTGGLGVTYVGAALPPQQFATPYVPRVEFKMDKGGFYHAAWVEEAIPNTPRIPTIRYMTNAGGTFRTESIAGPMGLPSEDLDSARLVIDTCGRPTVVYRRKSYLAARNQPHVGRIFVASRVQGGWVEEELIVPKSATDSTQATNILAVDAVMDANDTLVVVTRRQWQYQHFPPVLSKRGPGGWTHDTLSVVGAGEVHIASSSTMGLVLAYNSGSSLTRPTVAVKNSGVWVEFEVSSDSIGYEHAIDVTASADGTVHLAYVTGGNAVPYRLRYSSIASAVTGPTKPVPVPLSNTLRPVPIRVVTTQAGAPRILFQQFEGWTAGSEQHTYVSTMSVGAFGMATDLGAYYAAGAAIDGNDRLHVVANRSTSTIGSAAVWQLTQACAP